MQYTLLWIEQKLVLAFYSIYLSTLAWNNSILEHIQCCLVQCSFPSFLSMHSDPGSDVMLLRGSVFFIGMCLWGSQRVTNLKYSNSTVLPSMLQVRLLLCSWSHSLIKAQQFKTKIVKCNYCNSSLLWCPKLKLMTYHMRAYITRPISLWSKKLLLVYVQEMVCDNVKECLLNGIFQVILARYKITTKRK